MRPDESEEDKTEDEEDTKSGPHADETTTKQSMSPSKFSIREQENTEMAKIDEARQQQQAEQGEKDATNEDDE